MEKIDSLDRQILEIISQNARIPFKDVAAECGVSRAAIHQRVQRLIDLGVIIGSGYHVNPKSLGYRTCTYVGIKLEKGSMYKNVVAELKKIPEIVECHFTTGPYTMLTKLYSRDNEHLMDLLNSKIQEIPGVCGGANESCPAFTGKVGRRLHIGFDDPSHAVGTPEFIDAEFRRVRDEIKNAFARFYLTEIKKQELPKCSCGGCCDE